MSVPLVSPVPAAAALPVGDPQFWVVTVAVIAAVALLAWRLRRAARSGPALPCATCPKAAAHRKGAGPARLPLVALAVLLGGPLDVALAVEQEPRVEQLAREVEKLKAAVAELQARQPTADVAELERRIELLAAEIEELELGAAAPAASEGVAGFGPAASKVYSVAQGLSIGGYGELLYQGVDSRRDDGTPSNRSAELDLVRAIVYFGYKWDENWLFNSEIEWEHAKAGEGQRGEVAVEFAYVERRIRPEINARAGLLLVPMGLVNELHEPTVFLSARRPGIESAILPTTWRENGLGIFGEIGPLTYRTYVMNGFEARRFGAGGLRGARQNGARAVAEDFAWVGRLDWTGTPGLVAGVAGYAGDSGQDLEDAEGGIDVGTRILDVHLEWRWRGLDLRGLWVEATLDDVARLDGALGLTGTATVGERLDGWYVEAGYDVLTLSPGARQSLTPFARWETYDTQAAVPAGFAASPANDVDVLTLGLAWKPIEQVVVKGDFQDVDNAAGTGVDQFNLALGFVF